MNHQIVPISQLTTTQITELARLHHRVMHSLLSDLGLPIVERFYEIVCNDSDVVGFCGLSEMGHPLGWAIGSLKPDQLNSRVREAPIWFIVQMARALITRPRLLRQLIASVRGAAAPLPEDAIELTYIGVDAPARQRGLGRELLHLFIQAARERKCRSVVLSVEAGNDDAIALYTKAGFKILDFFTEGRFKRHRMGLTI
jgi:ribosomal protein S18 acetylase RimI-like enzyme